MNWSRASSVHSQCGTVCVPRGPNLSHGNYEPPSRCLHDFSIEPGKVFFKWSSAPFNPTLFLSLFLSFFQTVFQVTPLDFDEWITVMKFSIPVVLLDETLKFVARKYTDGKGYLSGIHGVLLMWVVFALLIWHGPI